MVNTTRVRLSNWSGGKQSSICGPGGRKSVAVVAVVVGLVGPPVVPSVAPCEEPVVVAEAPVVGSVVAGSPEVDVTGAPLDSPLAAVDSSSVPPTLSEPQAVRASTVSGTSQAEGRIIATLFRGLMRMRLNVTRLSGLIM